MITNVLATMIVMVITNVYAPKQYLEVSPYMNGRERWVDEKPEYGEGTYWVGIGASWDNGATAAITTPTTRDNPDVRIVEVREIRKWRFNLEGVPDHFISDKLLRKTERRRTVKTEETWTETELDVDSAIHATNHWSGRLWVGVKPTDSKETNYVIDTNW
jgi:hypothetical protein